MGRKVKEGTPRDKQNERRRTWYANLPEEKKMEMRQKQREYAKARYARRKGELNTKEEDLQKQTERRRTWYANLPEEKKMEMRQKQREYAKAWYARRMGELNTKEEDLQCNPEVADVAETVNVSTYEAGCASTCNATNLNVLSASMIHSDDVVEDPMVVESLRNAGTVAAAYVQPMAIGDEASSSGAVIFEPLNVPSRKNRVDLQPEKMKEDTRRDKQNEWQRKWYAKLPEDRKNVMRQKQREYAKARYAQRVNELNIDMSMNAPPAKITGGVCNDAGAATLVTENIDINSNVMNANAMKSVDLVRDAMNMESPDYTATLAGTGTSGEGGRESGETTISLDVACGENQSHMQVRQKKHSHRLQRPYVTMSKSGNALRSRNYRAHRKDASKKQRGCADAKEYWETKRIEMDLANSTKRFDGCSWSKLCCNCGVQQMRDEADSFCCNNGKRILPKLPDLPPVLVCLYNVNGFSQLSRKVNRLLSFTALCVCGQFVKLRTPSSVAMMGQAYHQILPSSMPHQPLHWYIHDDSDRYDVAEEKKVPFEWVGRVSASLQEINPFCKSLKMMSNMHMQTAVLPALRKLLHLRQRATIP